MGSVQNKLQKRREAENKVKEIFRDTTTVNVIHYSCESFYNNPTGQSRRITSIAIRNLESAQTVSFSIHQIAERKKIDLTQIETHYDMLEKEMLKEFYKFAKDHIKGKWLHWNMRDTNYGFPAIGHRYSVLSGGTVPVKFEESRLFDLARILIDKYGQNYAGHPRLEQLMALNKISAKDALPGGEEAKAFENKEYVKLHQSTLRKVDVIASIAEREWNGTLKTQASWKDEYGTNIWGRIEAFQNNAIYPIISLLALFYALIEAIAWLYSVLSNFLARPT